MPVTTTRAHPIRCLTADPAYRQPQASRLRPAFCSSMNFTASPTVWMCLGGVVGDFDVELFLEGHHQLDVVEAVGAQVVDEARLFGSPFRIGVQVLDDDLADAFENIGHTLSPSVLAAAGPSADSSKRPPAARSESHSGRRREPP